MNTVQDVETHLNPNSIGLEGGTPQYYNTLPENHSMEPCICTQYGTVNDGVH